MTKHILFLLWLALGVQVLWAQSPDEGACISHSMHEEHLKANPHLPDDQAFEDWLARKMAEAPGSHAQRDVLTIPVVIHVIHNGEPIGSGANIPLSQVQSQMEVLREDFRKLAGTPGDNDNPVGADTQIEFCLAYLGPDGRVLDESGVDRVDRNELGFEAAPYSGTYVNAVIKPQTIWDETQYMNIWVVDGISPGNVAGFATLPTGPAQLPDLGNGFPGIDGLVVGRRFFGRQANSNGRTATHEIGHWLGLRHVSGPYNAGDSRLSCDTDDFCEDTPNADGSNQGCGSSNSCGSADPIDNFMVGTLGSCRRTFTACQANRMRTVLLNSPRRVELLTSPACQRPTKAPIAAFTFSDPVTCDGRVQFLDASQDLPTNWLWTFEDGTILEDRNPVFQFDSSGTYSINLTVWNEFGFSEFAQEVVVTVNGGVVDVGEDVSACLGDVVQLDATTSVPGGSLQWFPTTGLNDATIANPILTAGSVREYVFTQTLANGCEIKDTLRVDAAPNPTTLAFPLVDPQIMLGDSVQLNAIGADSYRWSPGTGLSDSTIANPIAKPEQTTLYTVRGTNTSGCARVDEVLVTVNNTTSRSDGILQGVGHVFPPYPNPSQGSLTLKADFQQAARLAVVLTDLRGRTVATMVNQPVGAGPFQQSWEPSQAIGRGLYFISWNINGRTFVQKVEFR